VRGRVVVVTMGSINVVKIVSGKKSPGSRKQRFVKIGKTSAKNRQT